MHGEGGAQKQLMQLPMLMLMFMHKIRETTHLPAEVLPRSRCRMGAIHIHHKINGEECLNLAPVAAQ